MGITKECSMCNSTFTTKSMRSASWEHKCHNCYTERRRTLIETKHLTQIKTIDSSLRKEMEILRNKVSNIDILISAEVKNCLQSMTDSDIYEAIKTSIDNRLDSLEIKIQESIIEEIAKIDKENEKFRTKTQKQITILNGRIIEIMKEREE